MRKGDLLMEEIVSNVFIQYKTGFVAGKEKIVKFTKLGVPLDLSTEEDVCHYGIDLVMKMLLLIFLKHFLRVKIFLL